ncbi:MAG TPA: PEP-CTERM sorting domain-containing protein [Chthoniobacterales bacterium]|nr:PEP-CTERM sorting domain-containing protein [Chthoniobacterales bacterium]
MKLPLIAGVIGVALSLAVSDSKATSIYNASYDGSGNIITSGNVTLDDYVVVGIYNGSTAFIYDGTAYGRIFGANFVSQLQVGGKYSGTSVDLKPYQTYQEFSPPLGQTPTQVSLDNPISFVSISDISTIASTAPLASSPSGGSTYNLNFAPITFTFTPGTDTALSSGGSVMATDANGTTIQFYRSVTDDTMLAGQSYTVTAYVQGYQNMVELVGASFEPVPEPGSLALLVAGTGFIGLVIWKRRRKTA